MIANHIGNHANPQELICKSLANGNIANVVRMDDDSDKALIEGLVSFTGKSASQLALAAKLTPSTLTRPLHQQVNFKLSKATIDKLKAAFPNYPGFGLAPDLPTPPVDREYVSIAILPSYAGMGGGGTGEGDPEKAMLPRKLIEEELRGKPEHFELIDVRGDSMQPDFEHVDQILVDKRDRDPVQPGAFALWDGDGYVVKLVERVPQVRGQYRIFSANGRYQSYEVAEEDIRIMGRPVWFARRL